MTNYPGSLDDDISLFLVVNNARTRLTSNINTLDLTIPVVTTSGFPNQGFVTILSNPDDITEAEAIAYTGVTETSFSGTLRGAGDTPIFAHATGNNVDFTVMAEHHNELKDAVITLEQTVGISGSYNFVPKDAQGNVVVSGTLTAQNLLDAGWLTVTGTTTVGDLTAGWLTVTGTSTLETTTAGDLTADWLTVTGTSDLWGDVDIKGDLTVSGIASFGQDDTVASADSPVIFVSQDTEQTVTSTSFQDVNCETTALLDGVDYLIIYTANVGNDATTQRSTLDVFYGVLKIGGCFSQKSNMGTFGDAHYNAAGLNGIFKVTGDGVSTVKFQAKATGISTAYVGAMAITCVPLDQFTQNTDYYYASNTNNDTFDVINASATDPPSDSLLSSTFTGMAAGNWLFLWSDEASVGNAISRAFASRFQVDSVTVGPTRYARHNDNTNASIFTFASAHVVNVPTGGSIPAEILVGSLVAGEADFRRGRIFAINTALFSQVLSTTDSTGLTTNAGAFLDFTGLNTTVVPTNVNSPIIVFTSATSYTQDVNSGMTSALRNETDGIDYRDDSGGRNSAVGGLGATGVDLNNSFMSHFEERSSSTEYRYQIRTVGAGDVSVGRNDDDTGGEHSEMIVWEFIPTGTPFAPITKTIIDDDEIQTGTILTDNFNARIGLTVSGIPVSTGTGQFDTSADETITGAWDFSNSLTVSGVPVATGTVGGGGSSTLQEAYDTGDGTISTTGGKPFELTGTGELTAVTGTFTSGLTVGDGTTYIFPDEIRTGQLTTTGIGIVGNIGAFSDSLTISGAPVATGTGGGGVSDPLVIGTVTASISLTISGAPVATGTVGGGGSSTLQEAYDTGDGTISTTGGKPFELDGTGELTAVTGTFTSGLTVGTGSTIIKNQIITTVSGVFDEVILAGVPLTSATPVDNSFKQMLHVTDKKAANTAGGTFTSGSWQVRTLNTVESNDLDGSSLATDTITLTAGDYYVEWSCPGFKVSRHKSIFYNVTAAATWVVGTSCHNSTADNLQTVSLGNGKFSIAETSDFQLWHRCETTSTTLGFGVESNFGEDELYAEVRIWPFETTLTAFDTLTVTSGTFTESLTISGVPVATGTVGGGGGSVDETQVALLSQVFGY